MAFFGVDSDTYARLPVDAMHARGTCVAKDVDVVAARRLHCRSALRATVGPNCDMVMFEKISENVHWRSDGEEDGAVNEALPR